MLDAMREIFTDPFVLVVLGIAVTTLVLGSFAVRVMEEQDRQRTSDRRSATPNS